MLSFAGCQKPGDGDEVVAGMPEVTATPPAVVLEEPEPTPEPTPEFVHDPTAQVSILGYHRFEDKPRDALALSPEEFRRQMQRLKDEGIDVISMEDFFAWRAGERNIPERCAVITIDDGYDCTFDVAKPILEEFGYPYTVFVYLDFIDAGGRSITWGELEQLRDAGVDIGSHSLSHASLRAKKGRSTDEFLAFLEKEMLSSKEQLEDRLLIKVSSFAYPYGQYGSEAQKTGLDVGYKGLFTVNGQITKFDTPADALGRFVIQSGMPEIFENAIKFKNTTAGMENYAGAAEPVEAQSGTTSALPVVPASGAVIDDPRPEIRADFSAFGALDEGSVTMRIAGFGEVDPRVDGVAGLVSFKMPVDLREKSYGVQVEAVAGGEKRTLRWNFSFSKEKAQPEPQPAETSAAPAIPEV